MSVASGGKIRLGVVGLGPTWRNQYRPALRAAGDGYRIAGLFDQVLRRAEIEALATRSQVAPSLTRLIARRDLDAVALLDPQWFGLHALALAARAGKPTLVAVPLPPAGAELDRLDAEVRAHGPQLPDLILLARAQAAPAALAAFERLVRGARADAPLATWATAVAAARPVPDQDPPPA